MERKGKVGWGRVRARVTRVESGRVEQGRVG